MRRYRVIFVVFNCLLVIWLLFQIKWIVQVDTAHNGNDSKVKLDQVQDLVTFQACNGFANQRISILYGILIAINMRKPLVLPRLPLDGTQRNAGENVDSFSTSSEKFSAVYDISKIKEYLGQFNLDVWEIDDLPGVQFKEAYCPGQNYAACLEHMKFESIGPFKGVDFGCIFPSQLMSKEQIFQQAGWVKSILEHLVPANLRPIQEMQEAIRKHSKNDKYNFVHLRLEQDWIDHCKRWSDSSDGIIRDNCMNNTETIGHSLQAKNVSKSIPLYVAYQSSEADKHMLDRAIQNLKYNGYTNILQKEDLLTPINIQMHRELAAQIDYQIALESEKFVGNSVSSFTAMLLLERQFRGKWASYYNSGNVPMEDFLPLYNIAWVVYSRCDKLDFFNQVTSIGLQSINYYSNIELYIYCIGETDEIIANQLKSIFVKLILPQRITNYIKNPYDISNVQYLNGLLMLEEFSKHTYVVFSGPKIFSRKRIILDDFILPLPQNLATYTTSTGVFSGVMISNVEFIRSGFQSQGIQFFDKLLDESYELRTNDHLVQSIQDIDGHFNPRLIMLNQVSLMDLEKYLENGRCKQNLRISCDRIISLNCKFILEMLIFSHVSHTYPALLRYCNSKLDG